MTFEIELKIKLSSNDKMRIEQYLTSSIFKGYYQGGFEQIDYYFDTVPPSYAQKDTALRVRIEKPIDSSNSNKPIIELTYKGRKINPNSKTRLEYNINLAPETDFNTVEAFFKEIGFINAIHITKKRLNYFLEPGIVLSLDSNEIGDFVEIEKIIQEKEMITQTEEFLWNYLQKIIGPLTKDRRIVKSYLELIIESKRKK